MKFLLILIATFSSIAFAYSNNSKGKALIKTVINCSHCNACETCGLLFKANMYKIKGIKLYELDEKNQTFTVYYNHKKTNLEKIKEEIANLGYDADNVKANPEAYAKLDGCCKPK